MDFSILGYIATFFSATSFLPQAVKTVRTKDVQSLSLITYIFLLSASVSWFSYGVYLGDIPLMATNTLTSTFQIIILFMMFKEKAK
ncbi:SemiSWEET family transporter [Candidatus Actinomarina]|jgi:MtN3 and saliva related transmembrane protein|nr:SemiSWEET family transporter [bacterium]MDA8719379.1 SemiSWEET family transporter [Candidatus Actinomarina sp.]MDA8923321.1 SemiSWEET family transporter [Acidimicrobiia bacterium]MDA8813036.1 SemiSWEET family transporter [Candidatus Actinomarina sp.]MDA9655688.1 SemiSWEET family transporter [Candidatus Actinomarina sp.]|tara:strand:- start:167 stop:424 length:258 start_codon:yes stop_codon:yes gene_type:complete